MNKLLGWLAWGAGGIALNAFGETFAQLSNSVDWGLFGWAFWGSTVRFMWQNYKGEEIQKSYWQRFQLFIIGIVISIGLTDWLAGKLDAPKEVTALAVAFFAYYILDKADKRVKKDDTLDKLGK